MTSNTLKLRSMPFVSGFLLLVAAVSAASCSGDAERSGSGAAAKSAIPASFVLASEPAGAKPVKEAVAAAKSGDELVVTGRVGNEGASSAFFTLVDVTVKPCTEMEPPDSCPTPWDYCCEPSDEMAKASATVVFRDGARPYAGNLLGVGGLDHLEHVVVQGKAERDSGGNLTIVASGIYVRK